ncbi:hypothetical protein NDU88_010605 [Pleurodeles waltl]|uniref:Uncharacterized protein n=1 Tax=Pleurodeles waltl TaxID=8319 RepID=A0AAV7S4H3_PLEWA|nr:hypothetical protein NDU88_010605 [Pleurodeles waltl]
MGQPKSSQQTRGDPSKGENDAPDPVQHRDEMALDSHTAMILAAMKDTKESPERKIKTMVTYVNLLREDNKKLADRVVDVESTLAQARPRTLCHDEKLAQLEKDSKVLRERMEDAEGRSHRNNV